MTELTIQQSHSSKLRPGETLRVDTELGRGTQGIVFSVRTESGHKLAFKSYPKSVLAQDESLEERIKELVDRGSPHKSFLWPSEFLIATSSDGEEVRGYTMPIRDEKYISANALMSGQQALDFTSLIKACENICKAFSALHLHGFCYKDISFGNFFFDPDSGNCLICDIDNVWYDDGSIGGVLGTPYFMAPEIVEGKAKPSAYSDAHSLAVLMFYMLYIHHPLEGKVESKIKIMDDIARKFIYGSNALYIFHPTDLRNEPDPDVHMSALTMNTIMPDAIRSLMQKSFVDGLHNPNKRIVESEWCLTLEQVGKHIGHCENCGQEIFFEPRQGDGRVKAKDCWQCGHRQIPLTIEINRQSIVLSAGLDLRKIVSNVEGRVIRHPRDSTKIALKNESNSEWQAYTKDGEQITLPSYKSIVIGEGIEIIGESFKLRFQQEV